MPRRVWITGLGPISAAGIGMDGLWEAVIQGQSKLERIEAFDPTGFGTEIAGEVRQFKANQVVPKHYRKAVKVMARDIELAVGAANCAVRDAGLVTPGLGVDEERTYPGNRTGAHIGAGLIAADLDELAGALVEARDKNGDFDIHRWGREGMGHLTPLWLLKYLPNMLACHVTIIHDAQGPSNTLTCGEASTALSVAESMRVIERSNADCCYSGGTESKINPMAMYRQVLTGRLTDRHNDDPHRAVRPFDADASGTVIGEGGGIVVLEAQETAAARGAKPYAELLGFGAGHTIYPEGGGLRPDPEGKGVEGAILTALDDADVSPEQIDLVIPFGSGIVEYDQAEAAALRRVFGKHLDRLAIWSSKPFVGNCGAGSGAIDLAVAARSLAEQMIPARINCDKPIDGLPAGSAPAAPAELRHVLVYSMSLGGQNAATVLGRAGA
jgi:3-oxoacyl-[acyl-carrier-protein] synthase II